MKLNKIVLAIPGILFLMPILTFVYTVKESISTYDAVSKSSESERPSALAARMSAFENVHYYGIAGYYLGLILMLVFWMKGFKAESKILWVMAISAVIFVCAKNAFILGIITGAVLIWNRKKFWNQPQS
jgi:hypothetical protein